MTRVVVDANVAIKWLSSFRSEPLVPQAQRLLDLWEQGAIELISPDLIWLEIANAHWKAVRQNRCSAADAEASLAKMHQQNLTTLPSEPLIDLALRIALLHGRTVYDSVYVALADTLNSDLITADEKLANAIGGSFRVRWLGAI